MLSQYIIYIYIMKVFHGNTISEIPSGNFRMCEMDNHHFNSENHLDMGHVSWLWLATVSLLEGTHPYLGYGNTSHRCFQWRNLQNSGTNQWFPMVQPADFWLQTWTKNHTWDHGIMGSWSQWTFEISGVTVFNHQSQAKVEISKLKWRPVELKPGFGESKLWAR